VAPRPGIYRWVARPPGWGVGLYQEPPPPPPPPPPEKPPPEKPLEPDVDGDDVNVPALVTLKLLMAPENAA
jgi:hypothetical protein